MVPIRTTPFPIFLATVLASTTAWAQGPEIAARQTVVMTSPPKLVPSGRVVDGPILGNGDLGIAIGGPPEEQGFYFGKNDFWSQQMVVMSVGGLKSAIPGLAGASYQQEQDIANGEVRATFSKAGQTVRMRTWTAQGDNLAVTEIGLEGGAPLAATVTLFPEATALRENDKPVNIGREQGGNGRWYFEGLLDEVQLFDRALPGSEVKGLARLERIRAGLLRRWAFEPDEGTTPQETALNLVMGPAECPGPLQVLRSTEWPTPQPTRCMPEGYYHDYQRYSLGKDGRALKLMHEWLYADAGTVPRVKQVTVSAWVYIFSAGDANYILSKGAWNEAYALCLDRGRLRFNVGERFVRTAEPLPVNKWLHVAGTFDGAVLHAYVNGEEVMPRARFLTGGSSANMMWRSRNADGPLDEGYRWEMPIPPTTTPGVQGREVTWATRLVGARGTASGDGIGFSLEPGAKVYLVSAIFSDLDDPRHLSAAQARLEVVTTAAIEQLSAANRAWWRRFWSESFVEIHQPLLEKYYYVSQYLIAAAARTGKVAPGLYGPWVTTDHPSWDSDYTLNYNHQMPYYGLYSSNHIAITDPYDPPLLAVMERGRLYARTMLNVRGLYYPGHIGPWGLERAFDYEPFMGSKDDAAFSTVNMLMRFYRTYDLDYARMVYPFIKGVGDFWEDYLTLEGDRYAILNSCSGESGPWLLRPNYNACRDQKNAPNNVRHVHGVFKGLLDMSAQLGVDAGRRAHWQYILDHLPEVSNTAAGMGLGPGSVGFSNTQDPKAMLAALAQQAQTQAYPNGYLFRAGGGVESASIVPQRINNMLLLDSDVLKPVVMQVFPLWPRDLDARFGNLRAVGAFLVSSEMRQGVVRSLTIVSEKGRDCTLRNPWPGQAVTLYRAGRKAERLTGETLTFQTRVAESIEVRPQ